MLIARRIALGLVIAALLAGCGDDGPATSRSAGKSCATAFDAKRWRVLQEGRSYEPKSDQERLDLGRRLVRCRDLANLRRAEVEQLLGPPSDSSGDSMEYYLAPERGRHSIDQIWLFIDIERGRVTSWEVAQG